MNLVFMYLRGASKIKVKNVNKKRMATARRLIFFGISQGISEDQNSTFSLFETFGKKLAETKIVARVNVKKITAKKLKKGF
jgi:hypothetical protein